MSYLDELSRELAAHGIRGRRAGAFSPRSTTIFARSRKPRSGSARREIANKFAAELGAHASRRAAVSRLRRPRRRRRGLRRLVRLARLREPADGDARADARRARARAVVVAPQVAFVAGSLALVRAMRRRGERVMPTGELVVLRAGRLSRSASGSDHGRARALRLRVSRRARRLVAGAHVRLDRRRGGAPRLAAVPRSPRRACGRRSPARRATSSTTSASELGGDPWRLARWVALAAGRVVWLAAAARAIRSTG